MIRPPERPEIPEEERPRERIAQLLAVAIVVADSRRLAEAHGGTLSLEESGVPGTTFVLRLPASNPTGRR